ncbi:hypothetical protein EDD17DRAFT_1574887 [Pisolithus thermaeus]|nr:hypothetical protein EDD17DRAFT_1574887 [Pisolithus thermaeus]
MASITRPAPAHHCLLLVPMNLLVCHHHITRALRATLRVIICLASLIKATALGSCASSRIRHCNLSCTFFPSDCLRDVCISIPSSCISRYRTQSSGLISHERSSTVEFFRF